MGNPTSQLRLLTHSASGIASPAVGQTLRDRPFRQDEGGFCFMALSGGGVNTDDASAVLFETIDDVDDGAVLVAARPRSTSFKDNVSARSGTSRSTSSLQRSSTDSNDGNTSADDHREMCMHSVLEEDNVSTLGVLKRMATTPRLQRQMAVSSSHSIWSTDSNKSPYADSNQNHRAGPIHKRASTISSGSTSRTEYNDKQQQQNRKFSVSKQWSLDVGRRMSAKWSSAKSFEAEVPSEYMEEWSPEISPSSAGPGESISGTTSKNMSNIGILPQPSTSVPASFGLGLRNDQFEAEQSDSRRPCPVSAAPMGTAGLNGSPMQSPGLAMRKVSLPSMSNIPPPASYNPRPGLSRDATVDSLLEPLDINRTRSFGLSRKITSQPAISPTSLGSIFGRIRSISPARGSFSKQGAPGSPVSTSMRPKRLGSWGVQKTFSTARVQSVGEESRPRVNSLPHAVHRSVSKHNVPLPAIPTVVKDPAIQGAESDYASVGAMRHPHIRAPSNAPTPRLKLQQPTRRARTETKNSPDMEAARKQAAHRIRSQSQLPNRRIQVAPAQKAPMQPHSMTSSTTLAQMQPHSVISSGALAPDMASFRPRSATSTSQAGSKIVRPPSSNTHLSGFPVPPSKSSAWVVDSSQRSRSSSDSMRKSLSTVDRRPSMSKDAVRKKFARFRANTLDTGRKGETDTSKVDQSAVEQGMYRARSNTVGIHHMKHRSLDCGGIGTSVTSSYHGNSPYLLGTPRQSVLGSSAPPSEADFSPYADPLDVIPCESGGRLSVNTMSTPGQVGSQENSSIPSPACSSEEHSDVAVEEGTGDTLAEAAHRLTLTQELEDPYAFPLDAPISLLSRSPGRTSVTLSEASPPAMRSRRNGEVEPLSRVRSRSHSSTPDRMLSRKSSQVSYNSEDLDMLLSVTEVPEELMSQSQRKGSSQPDSFKFSITGFQSSGLQTIQDTTPYTSPRHSLVPSQSFDYTPYSSVLSIHPGTGLLPNSSPSLSVGDEDSDTNPYAQLRTVLSQLSKNRSQIAPDLPGESGMLAAPNTPVPAAKYLRSSDKDVFEESIYEHPVIVSDGATSAGLNRHRSMPDLNAAKRAAERRNSWPETAEAETQRQAAHTEVNAYAAPVEMLYRISKMDEVPAFLQAFHRHASLMDDSVPRIRRKTQQRYSQASGMATPYTTLSDDSAESSPVSARKCSPVLE